MGEVRVEVLRIAKVLGGDDLLLDPRRPLVGPQQRRRGAADEVGGLAFAEEVGYAVVLAAEGDEGLHWRGVAALDVPAQELAALGEADGVEAGGELWDVCELGADIG